MSYSIFGTKFHCQQFPRPHAKAMGHVVLGDDEIFAPVVFAPNDDVGMGLACVVVINGHPIEFGLKVTFDLGHEVTDERFEVMELSAILWRHDQSELVSVTFAIIEEGCAIGFIGFRP